MSGPAGYPIENPANGQWYYEETASVNGVPGMEHVYQNGHTEFVADAPVVGSSASQPTTGSPGPSTPTYGATSGTAAPSTPAAAPPTSTSAPASSASSDSGGPIMPPPVADPAGRGYYIQTEDDGRKYYTVEENNHEGYWKMYTNGGGGQYVTSPLPASEQSMPLEPEVNGGGRFQVVMNSTFQSSTPPAGSSGSSSGQSEGTTTTPVIGGSTGPVDGRPITLPVGTDPVVGGSTSSSGDTTTVAPVVVGGGSAPSSSSTDGSTGGTSAPGDSSTPTVVASTAQPGSGSSGGSDSSGGGTVAPASAPSGGTYTVVHGDTMWGIAQANGISLSQLEALNPQISNPRLIFPGQNVNLGSGGTGDGSSSGGSTSGSGSTYTVVHGDTLSGIAASNGMTTSQIESLNPQIKDPDLIFPGQSVNLAGGGSTGDTSGSSSSTQANNPSASSTGATGDSNNNGISGGSGGASGAIGFPEKSSYPFGSLGAEAEKALEGGTPNAQAAGWVSGAENGSTDIAKQVFEAGTQTSTDPLKINEDKNESSSH